MTCAILPPKRHAPARVRTKGVAMVRIPRELSESGLYHVVCRGNGRQIIFEDDADRIRFLDVYASASHDGGMSTIAWCLMDNHVHLLVRDEVDALSTTMQRVLGGYAARYNARTMHVGHLFQERFYSRPIEDEDDLLAAVRYIHQNPLRGGLASSLDFRLSSYAEYLGRRGITDTALVLDLLGGMEEFVRFSRDMDQACYRFEGGRRIPDGEMADVSRQVLGGLDLSCVKALDRATRDTRLARLYEVGLSVRQIERLTGVGRGAIECAIHRSRKNMEYEPVPYSRSSMKPTR